MMQAGRYFVGDLCYVMHPEWDEVCNLFFEGRTDHGCNEGEFTLKDGRRFAAYNTLYGDGLYGSNRGTSHPVDAGLIGCIRIEDISEDVTEAHLLGYGAIVTFDTDFDTGTSPDGTIRFDTMEVYTGDTEDEEIYLTSNCCL
jgi:hypothetical protein